MKKTPWFGGDEKPVHVGVYEREFSFGTAFSLWDGECWRYGEYSVEEAAVSKHPSPFQSCKRWRGIAKEQT